MQKFIVLLLIGFALSGCQSNLPQADASTPKGDLAGVDNTGSLGSPEERSSMAKIYVELSSGYLKEGMVSEALKNAKKAVMVEPTNSDAHNLLGIIYQRLAKPVLAGQHFVKSVELDPYNPYSLNALGSFQCSQGQYDEALSSFNQSLANPLYPTPWIALFNSGSCAEKQGDVIEAEKYYRQALKRNPTFTQALSAMAKLSNKQDKAMSVRAYLQRHAAVNPLTPDLLLLGVETEKRLGNTEAAALYASELMTRHPTAIEINQLN